jgi:hypothetical protein
VIEPDGATTYEASSPETGIDQITDHGRIPSDELLRLVETVQDADFFSLDDACPYQQGVSYEDGSTYTIQVTIEGWTKCVTCYQSECPSGFNQVIRAIREVWAGDILEVGV